MIMSETMLSWLIGVALAATMVSPIILLGFLIRDLKKGQIW